jgi:mRNA-degrading endonuclease toxin of MazEF toxin-antitoxin module
MVDQVKSLDLAARRVQVIGKAPEDFVEEVLSILDACIF